MHELSQVVYLIGPYELKKIQIVFLQYSQILDQVVPVITLYSTEIIF